MDKIQKYGELMKRGIELDRNDNVKNFNPNYFP